MYWNPDPGPGLFLHNADFATSVITLANIAPPHPDHIAFALASVDKHGDRKPKRRVGRCQQLGYNMIGPSLAFLFVGVNAGYTEGRIVAERQMAKLDREVP